MAALSGTAGITTTGSSSSAVSNSLTLDLASNTNFDVAAFATLNVLGTITGSGALNKIGIGKLTLAKDNLSFTGATTIDAGTISLRDGNALVSSSALTINSGGTLELAAIGGGTFNVNALSGAGAVRGGTAGLQTLDIKSGGGLFSGAITDGTGTVALKHDTSGVTYLTGTGNT